MTSWKHRSYPWKLDKTLVLLPHSPTVEMGMEKKGRLEIRLKERNEGGEEFFSPRTCTCLKMLNLVWFVDSDSNVEFARWIVSGKSWIGDFDFGFWLLSIDGKSRVWRLCLNFVCSGLLFVCFGLVPLLFSLSHRGGIFLNLMNLMVAVSDGSLFLFLLY